MVSRAVRSSSSSMCSTAPVIENPAQLTTTVGQYVSTMRSQAAPSVTSITAVSTVTPRSAAASVTTWALA